MKVKKSVLVLSLCAVGYFVVCAKPLAVGTPEAGVPTMIPVHNKTVESVFSEHLVKDMKSNGATEGLALLVDISDKETVSIVCGQNATCGANTDTINQAWEPGSVMKPFIAATALDTKSVTLSTKLKDDGVMSVGGYDISNVSQNYPLEYTVHDILALSRNTGAVNLLKSLDAGGLDSRSKQVWFDYVRNHFRLTDSSSLFVPDPVIQKQSDFRYALSSFGVGITTTPLKLALSYSIFINEGKLCGYSDKGSCTEAISSQSATQTRDILTDIAHNQHGMPLLQGYRIGGKSGTAQTPGEDGVYLERNTGTYIGFIESQASSKKFVLLVRYKQPFESVASAKARETWRDILIDLTNSKM